MTERTPRQRGLTRAEADLLLDRVAALEVSTIEGKKALQETHDKVSELHKALMMASPGQEKSLLDRMAAVTINVESGGRVAGILIKLAGVLAAIGAIWALVASVGRP